MINKLWMAKYKRQASHARENKEALHSVVSVTNRCSISAVLDREMSTVFLCWLRTTLWQVYLVWMFIEGFAKLQGMFWLKLIVWQRTSTIKSGMTGLKGSAYLPVLNCKYKYMLSSQCNGNWFKHVPIVAWQPSSWVDLITYLKTSLHHEHFVRSHKDHDGKRCARNFLQSFSCGQMQQNSENHNIVTVEIPQTSISI